MTRLAWAAPFLILVGCIAIAATFLRPGRLTRRERAAWRTITRQNTTLQRQLAAAWQDEITRLENDIDRLGRHLREHLGPEGDGT